MHAKAKEEAVDLYNPVELNFQKKSVFKKLQP